MNWNSIKTEIKTWYQSPYAANMDAIHWFLFLGFLIACMIGWRIVISAVSRD